MKWSGHLGSFLKIHFILGQYYGLNTLFLKYYAGNNDYYSKPEKKKQLK